MFRIESPNSACIIAGDLNPMSMGFQSRRLKMHYNFKQVVKRSIGKHKILDLISRPSDSFTCALHDTLTSLPWSDLNIVIWK